MWQDLPRPVVIAHRGDKSHAPENTLAAFRMAAEKGAPAIEFDVKLSRDGRVLVIHDQTVNRTSDGRGKVKELTWQEMRALDAGAWFNPAFAGERIPSLEEVFEELGTRLHMNIELTNYTTPGDSLVAQVVSLVKRHALQPKVIFSSFFPRNVRMAHALLPDVPCGLLTWSGWMGWWGRTTALHRKEYFALHPCLPDVDERLVSRCHALQKSVNVWTVNGQDDLQRMFDLGVDGVFTDDPSEALRLLEQGA